MTLNLQRVARTTTRSSSILRGLVDGRLGRIRGGRLTIEDSSGLRALGALDGDPDPIEAVIRVRDDRAFYRAVAFGGSVGAGESYMDGAWESDDLTAVIRLLARNRDVLNGVEGGLARLSAPLRKLYHVARENTPGGSRRNIAAHYDLSNDFFRTFLDETMMYSCGIFERPDSTLHEASVAKLDAICSKLQLRPEHHVVEIGTGWGGFAIHAATRYGCHVTTTTISQAQHDVAVERVREAGVEDRVRVLLHDYRDLTGTYDRLVSIEMIEAVGHRYYDTFFRKCSDLLAPDGMMLLQAITIADQAYERALHEVDFIQRYIFPGSCIPSVAAMTRSVAKATDMRLYHLEDIGPHYARTLAEWRKNVERNRDNILELGFDERFLRMWEFYLCYCEGGFEERAIGDVHMLLTKPRCRREPVAIR